MVEAADCAVAKVVVAMVVVAVVVVLTAVMALVLALVATCHWQGLMVRPAYSS